MKATLSVSMIVRDESAHLAGALENLREFADEVVVLDTGSTDDTKRLAEAAGAVVRDFQWCDDFAKARYLKQSSDRAARNFSGKFFPNYGYEGLTCWIYAFLMTVILWPAFPANLSGLPFRARESCSRDGFPIGLLF